MRIQIMNASASALFLLFLGILLASSSIVAIDSLSPTLNIKGIKSPHSQSFMRSKDIVAGMNGGTGYNIRKTSLKRDVLMIHRGGSTSPSLNSPQFQATTTSEDSHDINMDSNQNQNKHENENQNEKPISKPTSDQTTATETTAAATTTTPTTTTKSKSPPPPGFLRSKFPNFPWHRLPDYLTYMRCLAIPLLILMFQNPQVFHPFYHRSTLFAMACFTDWLDGYLARRWDVSTSFGAFLDPVADKLIVSTALILLVGRYQSANNLFNTYLFTLPSSLILCREIAVSALREWMAQRGERGAVKVGMQGKIKTFATMVSLTFLLAIPESIWDALSNLHLSLLAHPWKYVMGIWNLGAGLGGPCMLLGLLSLYASAILTITSGSVYFKAAAPLLLQREEKKIA
mmetsp:Transcript_6009/g.8753  ORF Transcript_6009/g.8753 Transcript_6009/m.8753 type:complete len:401 (+) Transcript_6009:96-1298(+)